MISKNQIKFINSLKLKKYRDEHQLFIAEGVKIVPELLMSGMEVKQLLATEKWLRLNVPLMKSRPCETIQVTEEELKRISALSTPNEVLAVCNIPLYKLEGGQLVSRLSLVLDDIRDPGNLGTIIRIADWFGIEEVICSMESVDAFNPKVIQASMGAIARVHVHYAALEDFLRAWQGRLPIYGAMLGGASLYGQSLKKAALLLIGNESRGISEKLLPFISSRITIPPYGVTGERSESLNAAVATGIICAEFRRRQGESGTGAGTF